MIGIEEARLGAKIIGEKLGEKSEFKHYEDDYKNIGTEKLLNHARAEIITLNGLDEIVLSHEKSILDDFLLMINRIDGSFVEFTKKSSGILEKTYGAMEETEDNWFKVGIKLGIEIEKRKNMITKIEELNLSKEELKLMSDSVKYVD